MTFKPYDAVFEDLGAIGKSELAKYPSKKLWVDPRCSLALQEAIGGPSFVMEARSPVQLAKSIKNEVELEGFRQCHIRDAVALCKYFSWLESELVEKKNTTLSEAVVADKLEAFRGYVIVFPFISFRELSDFMGLSFDTISSTGANGAIIHYKPEHKTCAMVKVDQMYLCDSGGQYRYVATHSHLEVMEQLTLREQCISELQRNTKKMHLRASSRGIYNWIVQSFPRVPLALYLMSFHVFHFGKLV